MSTILVTPGGSVGSPLGLPAGRAFRAAPLFAVAPRRGAAFFVLALLFVPFFFAPVLFATVFLIEPS